MDITLYDAPRSRSARVVWTLEELELPYSSEGGRHLLGSEEAKIIIPTGKLPAVRIDGRMMFESAAICTWLADSCPEKAFIAPLKSWGRAMHEQWVSFALTELEAYLWSSLRNRLILPKEERIDAIAGQNSREICRGLDVLERYLEAREFLVDDRFSVTDIIVGFTTNWARQYKLLESYEAVSAYNQRLLALPRCAFTKPV